MRAKTKEVLAIFFAAGCFIVESLTLYVVLSEKGREQLMFVVLLVTLHLLSLSAVAAAVAWNLRDVRRAARLKIAIVTIKDDHATELAYTNSEHQKSLAEALRGGVRERDETRQQLADVKREMESLRSELSTERAVSGKTEHYKQLSEQWDRLLKEEVERHHKELQQDFEIMALKESAKAIRRQWPDAVFCKRPLLEQWWTPSPKQYVFVPWIDQAAGWYKQFNECRVRRFPYLNDRFLQSLDLEELLDRLDNVIMRQRLPSLCRDVSLDPSNTPIMYIDVWGAPPGDAAKCGFWISNHGDCAAVNIRIVGVPLGTKLLASWPYFGTLAKSQKDFIVASILHEGPDSQNTTPNDLEWLTNNIPINRRNGVRLSVIVQIIYEAKGGPNSGRQYVSRHDITLTDSGEMRIVYINTELVSTMPSKDAIPGDNWFTGRAG